MWDKEIGIAERGAAAAAAVLFDYISFLFAFPPVSLGLFLLFSRCCGRFVLEDNVFATGHLAGLRTCFLLPFPAPALV